MPPSVKASSELKQGDEGHCVGHVVPPWNAVCHHKRALLCMLCSNRFSAHELMDWQTALRVMGTLPWQSAGRVTRAFVRLGRTEVPQS